MATCMYCNAQIADGIKFCTECGAALPVEAPIETQAYEGAPKQAFEQAEQQPFEQQAQQAYQQAPNNANAQQYQQPYQQPGAGQSYQQPYQQPGAGQSYQQPGAQPQFQQPNNAGQYTAPIDSGSIGWGILGFLIPIVGIVLFFVWKDTKPKSGKVALIGALISIGLALIFQFADILH